MQEPGEKEAEETKDASVHSGPPALKSPESIARVKGILISWRETSAQRCGISAARLGLMTQAPSDHMPYQLKANLTSSEMVCMGWNLLSDVYLLNNYRNISGIDRLVEVLSEDNYYKKCIWNYFSSLGLFLYQTQIEGLGDEASTIEISEVCLEAFNQSAASSLEREARADIMQILLYAEHDYASEFELALQHCLQISYHIYHPTGSLRWENRFKLIEKDTALIHAFAQSDFICLQECTSPLDMMNLFPDKGCIQHRVNDETTDHCVILYDQVQFELLGEPLKKGLMHNSKPYILAKFRNKITGDEFIVGSLHHPGGKHNCLEELYRELTTLKEEVKDTPFFLLGDYNHSKDELGIAPSASYELVYPSAPTMAGPDFSNAGESIDGVMIQRGGRVDIRCLRLQEAAPVHTSLQVMIDYSAPSTAKKNP